MLTFKPHADLTFHSVISIRKALYKALMEAPGSTFYLDLSEVTHCDSAGLALLIEAHKLCKKNHKKLKVVGIPSETQSLAEFCGVKSILEAV